MQSAKLEACTKSVATSSCASVATSSCASVATSSDAACTKSDAACTKSDATQTDSGCLFDCAADNKKDFVQEYLSVKQAIESVTEFPAIGTLVPTEALSEDHWPSLQLGLMDSDAVLRFGLSLKQLRQVRRVRRDIAAAWMDKFLSCTRFWAVQGVIVPRAEKPDATVAETQTPPFFVESSTSSETTAGEFAPGETSFKELDWGKTVGCPPTLICEHAWPFSFLEFQRQKIQAPLNEGDIAKLLAASTPSGFGDLHTQTTRFDTAVRAAFEIAAPAISFSAMFDEKEFFQTAWSLLRPQGQCSFQLLKLNLYTVGGHFAAHVDTPKTPEMLGTVVLSVPVKGGCDGGVLRIFEPGSASSPRAVEMTPHPTQCNFVAFYGDCMHEVTPVTRGTRVTLTWAVFAKATSSSASCAKSSAAATFTLHPKPEMLVESSDDSDSTEDSDSSDASDTQYKNPAADLDSRQYEYETKKDMRFGTNDEAIAFTNDLKRDKVVSWNAAPIPASLQKYLETQPLALILRHNYPFTAEPPTFACLKGVDAAFVPWLLDAVPGSALIPVAWHYSLKQYDVEEDYDSFETRSVEASVCAFTHSLLKQARLKFARSQCEKNAGVKRRKEFKNSKKLFDDAEDAPNVLHTHGVLQTLIERQQNIAKDAKDTKDAKTAAPCVFIRMSEWNHSLEELFSHHKRGGNTGNDIEPLQDTATYVAWALLLPQRAPAGSGAGSGAPEH